MAKAEDETRPHLSLEILAVLGVVAGLFLVLCLVSFIPPDSSGEISNWGGMVGHVIAACLMSFLGLSAFWLPFLLFFLSFVSFFPVASSYRLPLMSLGCSGIVIANASLLGGLGIHDLSLFDRSYPLAGVLGTKMFAVTSAYFGGPGMVLFFSAVFLLSCMALFHLSPYQSGKLLVDGGKRVHLWRKQRKKDGVVIAEQKKEGRVMRSPASASLPDVKQPVRLALEDVEKGFEPVPVQPGEYQLPNLSLLDKPAHADITLDKDYYLSVSELLSSKLYDFGVNGKITGIMPGPVITTYEFEPAPGVKINKVMALADDLALGLKAPSVRVVGSVPGKAALGIEVPNPVRQNVYIREILGTSLFQKGKSKLTLGLGMDVIGNPVTADLAKMPHLLIAGTTGAGKSVGINTIICSILLKAKPEEVRLLMVDPKRVELTCYEGIPHLLHPVVVEPQMASRALQWAVKEMERRYSLMEENRVKSFVSFNESSEEKLPLIVIIIDELADLMMVASKEVEGSVARLAQMARAAGMHLILATQRPSVDVLTGLIKANFPTRMSFKVSSKIDSRTILDISGAENLLGLGDMLFLPPGTASLQRIHGAYITEKETERIVDFLKRQGPVAYDEEVIKSVERETSSGVGDSDAEYDEKYDEAVAIVCELGTASISGVQRRLRIGYNRAARIIETMEREGLVGPADGAKPRKVLVRGEYD
ncbi:MAG: DNA translocase FtsK 4TM domain-containing protein [Desulfobulbaceae bacterium]|jgi:S-DNA-T family DNA segregation ATPase FtsK/SpoIIIE|nr:DNA translocase FtsK 4TM domain-containing protein [Desulfobulbaceae bacterium]